MIKAKRLELYKEIAEKRKQGLSAAEIAKLYDMTRQGVWLIFMALDGKKRPRSVKHLTR